MYKKMNVFVDRKSFIENIFSKSRYFDFFSQAKAQKKKKLLKCDNDEKIKKKYINDNTFYPD